MENQNIFLSQSDNIENKNINNNDISGKITYTNIVESIPIANRFNKPIVDWQKKYKVEWRWRFLKDGQRHVVEISYIKKENKDRLYFNKYGQWTKQDIGPEYDHLVVKEYYVYTCE
jgi:hypothetical protein